jgi:hypothetical protein
MGFCYNDGCLNDADQRCSNCKLVTYCSTICQKEGVFDMLTTVIYGISR